MTLSFHALWMLCAFGVVVHATTAAQAMEKGTGQAVDPAAESMQSFAQKNDAQMAANLATVPAPSRMARQLEGYVMEQRTEAQRNEARRDASVNEYAALWASMPVLALLIVWKYKRRRTL